MKKLILIFFSFFIFSSTFSMYNLDFAWISDSFRRSLVWIHFKWWGNDIGGFLFITDMKYLSVGENINLWTQTRTNCQKQIKWYYQNSARWLVVYPLDNETLSYWKSINPTNYKNLTVEWWFYTLCDENPNSIYGQITYKLNWQKLFELYAWRTYDPTTNKITDSVFRENFQKIQWDKIVGLIYDTSFWVWFVWGYVHDKFNELVNALNTSWVQNTITKIDFAKIYNQVNSNISPIYGIYLSVKIGIKWLINLTKNINWKIYKDTESILRAKQWTVVSKTDTLNIWKIINFYRQKISNICNGKWQLKTDFKLIDAWKTYCIKADNKKIYVKEDLTIWGKRTDIIVIWKWNKLIIEKSQTWPGWINIFVDAGYVMFKNSIDYNHLIWANWELNPSNPVTSGAVYNWNIIIRGLVVGTDNGVNPTDFRHKLYIYGSLTSLNSLWEIVNRKSYIQKLGLDPAYMDIFKSFSWDCGPDGKWITDGVNCSNENDQYARKSLIIIKKRYKNIWE